MWIFASERRLGGATWGAVGALIAAAVAFHWLQNEVRPVGGEISWPKLFWLAYAIFLWFILPGLIAADPRLPRAWRRPFFALFLLMLARGVVEGWMLYVSLNWSPWYGIGHDLVCAALLFASAAALRAVAASRLERLMLAHLCVTALMFGPEIYFAWYMQAHFNTQGEDAIYFVPDDPAYAVVLRATTAAVAFLTLYLPVFLVQWLHGAPERNRPAAL
jgi:hypothetical protein